MGEPKKVAETTDGPHYRESKLRDIDASVASPEPGKRYWTLLNVTKDEPIALTRKTGTPTRTHPKGPRTRFTRPAATG